MTTAQRMFVVYGVVIMAYGLVLSVPLASIPALPNRSCLASGVIVDTNLGDPGQGWISTRLEDRKVETMSAVRQCWLTGDRTLSMSDVVVAGLGESALVGEDHPLGTVA